MASYGLVGLGLLGSALADRMLAAGHPVAGYDLDANRLDEFSSAGGNPMHSAADVVGHCKTLVLSLPDSQVVKAVIESIRSSLDASHLIVDTSTGDPAETEAIASSLGERGISYLDATVLGSSAQVRDGQAIVMVGGAKSAYLAVQNLLSCFGRETYHLGPPGAGARMKLVVNLVLGLNRAVLAEGLTLANALELDPSLTLDILKAGSAYSRVMDTKGEKMLIGDFTPQARLTQHLKDVRLMLDAAKRTDTRLPLSEVHRLLLERAEEAGYGNADNSAIVRAFDRQK